MNKSIIFISSHSHSGSTLLDLLLGAHPNTVGLGEVYPILGYPIEHLKQLECTCGQLAQDCVFWGSTIPILEEQAGAPISEKYRYVIESFYRIFGNNTILVDSSKYLPALNALQIGHAESIRIIRLIKDVRAFSISHKDILPKEIEIGMYPLIFNNKNLTKFLLKFTIKSSFYLFLKWYIRNIITARKIDETGHPYIKVSYENLCFDPENTLKQICSFIGLEFNPKMLMPSNHQNHILRGNQMRNTPQKLKNIIYDRRWMYRTEWVFPAFIFPFIMKFNAKEVYGKDPIFDKT